MRIVIGGSGEVPHRLAAELMADHEVVLIAPDEPGTSAAIAQLDVATVRASATSFDVLRKAGVERADVFIACGPDDEENLVACVAGRRLGAKRTLCFLFRRDVRTGTDDLALAELMGIDQVVRPSLQLADAIVSIASVPGALDVEVFEGGRVRLLRHSIRQGAPITEAPLREIGAPEGVVLVMGRRGDEIFIPSGDTHFQPGDKVTAMGNRKGLNRLLFKYLRRKGSSRDARTATVIGGGSVGLAVARGLSRVGWSVKVIEPVLARCEFIAPLLDGLVLHGDGSDLHLLEQEQVGGDSVLVAVTDSDEKNLLVSLLAKQLGVPRIVTRAVLPSNERLFERVGIDVVLSAQGAAINSVTQELVKRRGELLASLEHGDAEVLELELPKTLKKVFLRDLHLPLFAIVGAIRRGKKVLIPRGGDWLEPGDHVLVFCTKKDEDKARALFLSGLCQDAD